LSSGNCDLSRQASLQKADAVQVRLADSASGEARQGEPRLAKAGGKPLHPEKIALCFGWNLAEEKNAGLM
jgi:hypothetical protein